MEILELFIVSVPKLKMAPPPEMLSVEFFVIVEFDMERVPPLSL